jgi:uncharacterized protein (DUF342 family)
MLDMQEKMESLRTVTLEGKTVDPEPREGMQTESTQEPEEKAPQEPSFELVVSEDRLKAHLLVISEGDCPLSVEEIKKFLKKKEILFGLVSDSQIEEYIRTGIVLREGCLVAEGKPAEPGRDAELVFHFDRDPSKIGKIKEGGTIDFKDKGEIPQVEEGAVLAEKIPLVKEIPGTDVYGKPIPVAQAKDCPIRAGPGTRRSPNGLTVTAKIWGRPMVTIDDAIAVVSELTLPGDVGLETGHIHFEGLVTVGGSIQEGFRVRAKKLVAQEIFRGEVEIDGDIVVESGIIGARVSARGNIKARFIHSSQVSAAGDIIVQKEIIDSRIETGGNLLAIPSGRVFTSQVIAKKGIEAGQIGSDSSKPCALTVGVDRQTQEWIKKMREEISLKTKERGKSETLVKRLEEAFAQLGEKIIKLTQVEEKALLGRGQLKEKMETYQEEKEPALLNQAHHQLQEIEGTIARLRPPLQQLRDQQDQITGQMNLFQDQINDLDAAIRSLQAEIQRLTLDFEAGGIPAVKVSDKIYAGTTIEGLYSRAVLEESFSKSMISEKRISRKDPEGNAINLWEMHLRDLG